MADEARQVTAVSPLLAVWRRPGRTVAALVAGDRGHAGALLIAAFFGMLNARRWLVAEDGGTFAVNWASAPAVLAVAASTGVALLWFYAWLYRNFGRWMGGSGGLRSIRTGMGWGLLPAAAVLALAFVFPSSTWLAVTKAPAGEPAAAFTTWGYLLFGGFAYAWGIFLLAVAAAHRLPVLRAFAALAIAFLVSIVPLSILVQVLGPG